MSKTEAIEKTKQFFDSCKSRLRSPIPRIWVVEPHKNLASYHIHFLLGNVSNISENVPQILFNKWRKISGKGRFRTDKYDARRDAGGYLTKYILKNSSYYSIKQIDKFSNRKVQYSVFDLKHAIKTLEDKREGKHYDNERKRRRGGRALKGKQKTTKVCHDLSFKFFKTVRKQQGNWYSEKIRN